MSIIGKVLEKMKGGGTQDGESKKVKVFTTQSCPHCKKLKRWLLREGIDFVGYNVAENKEKAKEMIKRTGRKGVPQTFIGNTEIIGFKPQKIKEALEK